MRAEARAPPYFAMPELPDISVYLEALEPRIVGETLNKIRLYNIFVLRSVSPKPKDVEGSKVTGVRRLGKRIVIELAPPPTPSPSGDGEGALEPVFLVLHLMI